MIGQIQRFSYLESNLEQKAQLTNFADKSMARVINDHKETSTGAWYWIYGDGTEGLNELAHTAYIVDGIRNYITFDGQLTKQIDWRGVIKSLDYFYAYNGLSIYEFSLIQYDTLNTNPRLYDLGSFLHIVSLCKPNHELLKNLVDYSEKYRLPSGHYTKQIYPVLDDGQVINEYESFILYGWSIILSNQSGKCFSK